jgi:hypothetical protein
MPNSPEKQWFDSAKSYYLGATLLMKPPETSELPAHLAQPAVTCASLSLKLYLKCLLSIESKDKDDSLYSIGDLYRALSGATKKAVLGKFDEFSNSELTSEELLKHLDALDNSLIKWRYIHVDDAKNVNLEDLEEMILAVKAAILMKKTEWD